MSKRIVVCADGTWNKPEQENQGQPASTNVAKIAAATRPQDASGATQVTVYHAGVGERGGVWDHLSGGAFGIGISANIRDLYLFLIHNYQPGDELFLLGFSRGAYTVRSLAGLIRNSGLLRKAFASKYCDAYELYRDRDDSSHPRSGQATEFRRQFAWPDFNIHFIGVWDTVGALGIPVTPLRFWNKSYYEFHDVALSTHVDFAYHALAVDEHRTPFVPTLWQRQSDAPASQVLEQAWFPGSHCNVGGGLPYTGLSDGALWWMADRAQGAGLALDRSKLAQGNAADRLEDSMDLFYRVLGDGTRPIGVAGTLACETVHRSSLERIRTIPDYQPPNLGPFLDRDPPPPVSTP